MQPEKNRRRYFTAGAVYILAGLEGRRSRDLHHHTLLAQDSAPLSLLSDHISPEPAVVGGAFGLSFSHSKDTGTSFTMNSAIGTPPIIADHREGDDTIAKRAHYSPPWADVSIIGIAGSSGSGKTTLSHAIVNNLNLPWVVIMSMVRAVPPEKLDHRAHQCQDSFYKPLDAASSRRAFRNEYDFDAPEVGVS